MKILYSAILLTIALSTSALAQVVGVDEGSTAFVKVSIKDPNRIAIKEGRFKKIRFREDLLTVDKDEDLGELSVIPRDATTEVSLLLTDELGKTFVLILQPADIPAQNIVVDSGKREMKVSEAPVSVPGKNWVYEKRVISMLELMAGQVWNNRSINGVEVKNPGREIKLWTNARFFLLSEYVGTSGGYHGIKGEKFRLFNTGATNIVMSEQEFFKEGVSAIAIEKAILKPGEFTHIFVVYAEVGDE